MVWGLRLAMTRGRNDCPSCLGHWRATGLMAHAAYTLPPAFPQRLSADEKKKKAALKGKMLGGTTSGKPGSRGLGDMAIGRTEGVPQRIV